MIKMNLALLFLLTLTLERLHAADKSTLLSCQSSYENLQANFEVTRSSAQLKIKAADGKEHICGTSKPSFKNGKKQVRPFYRVTIDLTKNCSPALTHSLAKRLKTEVYFDQDLISNKTYLDWVSYSKPLNCEIKVNNLEKYFSSQKENTKSGR